MSRLPRTSSIARTAPALAAAVLLLGVLTWPLLFTDSGFSGDWNHHLWLMWHQSQAIESGYFPSLFLNSSYSVLYPTYAFYGGTVYAVGGLLSLAFGGAPVSAYVLVYILDFAAAFGGWYWLARMAGLGRWRALVPGLIFITSAYYIVVIYVQGDWPEFTGISMIPLMLAAALSVLRAQRLQVGPALALALSSILFFGSHNITIMLGLTTLALTGLACVVLVPAARAAVSRNGVVRVASIVVPAGLVSAWYLLPAFAYQSSTRIGSDYSEALLQLHDTANLVSLAHLFTFSRTDGPPIPAPYYLALSLPVLAIAWVLAGILILPWRNRNPTWTRVLLICSAMALLIAIVMTHVGLLIDLPRPYPLVEFSYRLETYVLLTLCAAILAALVLARGSSRLTRAWTWLALPVCAVSLTGAVQQVHSYTNRRDRYVTLEYPGVVETLDNKDYQDLSAPIIPAHGLAKVEIPFESVQDGRTATFSTRQPAGTLLATNIGAGPYLLHITGAKAVGIDSETDNMVLRVDGAHRSTAASAEHTITVSTGESPPIVLGRLLTLLGLAILAVELAALIYRRQRQRSHRPAVRGF
jgi:uncharacterized membrane protein